MTRYYRLENRYNAECPWSLWGVYKTKDEAGATMADAAKCGWLEFRVVEYVY